MSPLMGSQGRDRLKKKVSHYQMAHAQQVSQAAAPPPSQGLNREEMILKYAPLIKYMPTGLHAASVSHLGQRPDECGVIG